MTATPLARYAFAASGIGFALYVALRPWADEATAAGVAGMASGWWVASHLAAVAALILWPIAAHAAGFARAGLVLAVGSGLTLPYYGAETFGVQAVAAAGAPLPLVGAIRMGLPQVVLFAAGLALLAVGGVLLARRLGGWTGWPFAAGLVLFLPQFFGPAPLRIAHGVLVLVGCLLLARARFADAGAARRADADGLALKG